MTCIVGYVDKGDVYIGADSAGVGGGFTTERADEKVFIKENMIFGFTSSFRMGQIIRYCLKIPEHSSKKTDYDYLCTDFIDALMKCFKEKEFAHIEHNVSRGGVFLLGYRGNLYQIEGDYQVGKNNKNYDSCGCGFWLALGALCALEDVKAPPRVKIDRALKSAEEFSSGVRRPFNVLVLKGGESV